MIYNKNNTVLCKSLLNHMQFSSLENIHQRRRINLSALRRPTAQTSIFCAFPITLCFVINNQFRSNHTHGRLNPWKWPTVGENNKNVEPTPATSQQPYNIKYCPYEIPFFFIIYYYFFKMYFWSFRIILNKKEPSCETYDYYYYFYFTYKNIKEKKTNYATEVLR
jgi:hypothetical protein